MVNKCNINSNIGSCYISLPLIEFTDSPAYSATVTPGVSRPTIVDHKQRQRVPKKSGQLHVVVPSRCSLKPVPPPKPGTKSSSVQRYVNTSHKVAQSSKEAFTFSRVCTCINPIHITILSGEHSLT